MMNVTTKNLFLLDGLGAFVSFLFIGLLFPAFQKNIGMPFRVLYSLAAIAFLFSLNSLFCFWILENRRTQFLRYIGLANLTYCFLTALLVILNFQNLTALGITYFILEIMVILGLISVEWRHSQ